MSLHGSNCPCGECGAAEDELNRLSDAAVDAIPDVITSNFGDRVSAMLQEVYDYVGFEDGDTDDPDLRRIALQHITDAAKRELEAAR